jgi:hypothetical protein
MKLRNFYSLVLVLAAVFLLAAGPCRAEDSEWQWVESNAQASFYVDTKLNHWDSATDTLYFWEKVENLAGNVTYKKYKINMKKHGGYLIYLRSTGKFYESRPMSMKVFIHPDDRHEKEINVLCEKLHLPYIFGTKDHQWQWVYSNDFGNYYICQDTYNVSPDRNYMLIYVKSDYPHADGSSFVSYVSYAFDVKNQIYLIQAMKPATIVPGTPAARIFEAAKDMLHLGQ